MKNAGLHARNLGYNVIKIAKWLPLLAALRVKISRLVKCNNQSIIKVNEAPTRHQRKGWLRVHIIHSQQA